MKIFPGLPLKQKCMYTPKWIENRIIRVLFLARLGNFSQWEILFVKNDLSEWSKSLHTGFFVKTSIKW
jgi:hypothetical protein